MFIHILSVRNIITLLLFSITLIQFKSNKFYIENVKESQKSS